MDKEYKRLKRLLIIFGILTFLALAGCVIFMSAELRHLKSQVSTQPVRTETIIEKPAPVQLPTLEQLKGEKGDKGDTVVGAKGDRGAAGQVDYSLVKQFVQEAVSKIPPAKDGVNGVNAREIEFCKMPDSEKYGQRYIGTTICMPIEVGE